ncbi:thiolase family protein [Frankia sp. CNm7]|uniref:Probable acetyl-CoA acetyltransferase n=1 Tax=Frankia nepalensis TaxID=1836974 RepID=A0A937RMP7_9ACTN|nr:thiolase family protein [Frankia nepalensis]MBL7500194.1 thiolase family protein [Frankia nepalensis]MBL7509426.1 thiolase family protein [Frankia nepalensis]MBL7522762.1 thiolase family protein [Frankia nepalensis]MBL7631624.1 thiolase family protein [Frankia nepalensis]
MHEAVIVSTARTPVGTARKGSLNDVDAFELATLVVGEAVRRAGVDPELVDDVVLGEALYGGGDIARYAAIEAGLINAPGVAHNRHCASGMAAIQTAAASIMTGMDKVVVAGGTNSSSTSPRAKRRAPGTDDVVDWYSPTHRNTPEAPNYDMSITVGWNAAVKAGLSRHDLDAWALRSHQRAVAGIDAGSFKEEIVPVEVTRRDGTTFSFDTDEHPRRDTSLERLGALKVLHPEIEGFSITAGNASGTNDGAGAVVLTSRAFAEANGLEPLAVIRSWASVGVPPAETGLAPVRAIPKALERAGLGIADVTLWEINEAFASVPAAACKLLGIDDEIVNILGSGCSLGHPIAMTGTRQIVTLTHELRRRGGGVAVSSMCAGGGMASAVVFEVPAVS